MLWTRPGDMKAVCGESEIEVWRSSDGAYRGSIRWSLSAQRFGGSGGMKWVEEPSPSEFEAYVLHVLASLLRDGYL